MPVNNWKLLHPKATASHLGLLPNIIGERFGGTVAEQVARGYAHGGGYSPFREGKWQFTAADNCLKYPGDAKMKPIASIKVLEEMVYLYDHAIVAIVQADGTFAVIRMD